MKRFVAALLFVGGLSFPIVSFSNVVMTAQEVSGNVVIDYTGSIDTNTVGCNSGAGDVPAVVPAAPVVLVGNNTGQQICQGTYNGPANIGTGGQSFPSSSQGSFFGLQGSGGGYLFLPSPYTSGATISGSSTWTSNTLSNLGLSTGTYTFTFGSNTITVNVVAPAPAPAAVPTLSEWGQLMLALMVIGIAWHFHNNRQNSY